MRTAMRAHERLAEHYRTSSASIPSDEITGIIKTTGPENNINFTQKRNRGSDDATYPSSSSPTIFAWPRRAFSSPPAFPRHSPHREERALLRHVRPDSSLQAEHRGHLRERGRGAAAGPGNSVARSRTLFRPERGGTTRGVKPAGTRLPLPFEGGNGLLIRRRSASTRSRSHLPPKTAFYRGQGSTSPFRFRGTAR